MNIIIRVKTYDLVYIISIFAISASNNVKARVYLVLLLFLFFILILILFSLILNLFLRSFVAFGR